MQLRNVPKSKPNIPYNTIQLSKISPNKLKRTRLNPPITPIPKIPKTQSLPISMPDISHINIFFNRIVIVLNSTNIKKSIFIR